MGCDIHAFFEIKVHGDWLFYGYHRIPRDYKLFSRLANVRNGEPGDEWYIEPLSETRGFPHNASEMLRLHEKVYDGDAHSHSWISSQEYVALFKDYGDTLKATKWLYLFGNSFEDFYEYRDDFPDFVEDFRMCFFFDN